MDLCAALRRGYLRLYGWATERLYHEFAWAYEMVAWVVSLGRWRAWREAALDYAVGHRVLELGFGTGALLVSAAHRGLSVVGVDPSPAMQRVAARRLRRHGLSPSCVRARAQELPFAEGAFDTVIATFPTSYIADPTTLTRVARVLAPQDGASWGRLVVTGLGIRSDPPWVARLYAQVLGGGSDALAWFAAHAHAWGFTATVVDASSGLIRMPVLILEPVCAGRSERRAEA